MINTKPVSNVRTLFLRIISLCYIIAFHSLYIQIPGLYGDNGILPARSIIKESSMKSSSLMSLMSSKPTLLWLQPFIGLSVQQLMELICLSGMVCRGEKYLYKYLAIYVNQTWAYWSAILLGTIYWPFFDKKYNSSIAFLLLLLVIKILNIGLYLGNIWYCLDIVQ